MAAEDARGAKALVIDDDEILRDLLTVLLGVNGVDATLVSSGEEALDLLAHSIPEVILTDLQMPGLEGLALVEALRAATPSSTDLIGMSASTPDAALLDRLDAFVPKPFDADDLQNAFLHARQHRSALAPSPSAREGGTSDGLDRNLALPSARDARVGTPPVLDQTIFEAMQRNFRPPQLREVYDMTLADVLKRSTALEALAQLNDLPAIHREAHTIKGLCGMVGARELQFLATEAEQSTTAHTSAIRAIPAACERLRRQLEEQLPQ